MKNTARAAQKLGVGVVNGFTGSSIWHLLYSFPPVPQKMIDDGFELFAERLEPDPRRVRRVRRASSRWKCIRPKSPSTSTPPSGRSRRSATARSSASTSTPATCIWQGVDPVEFIRAFPDRIYHVHVKDAIVTLNGRSGILASHLNFGDPRRGWDFRSPGRGGVNFEEIIRALNAVDYEGPLSVEWEDSGMDREHGAREACEFVKKLDFAAERPGVRRGVCRLAAVRDQVCGLRYSSRSVLCAARGLPLA